MECVGVGAGGERRRGPRSDLLTEMAAALRLSLEAESVKKTSIFRTFRGNTPRNTLIKRASDRRWSTAC